MDPTDPILYWNAAALEANRVAHTPRTDASGAPETRDRAATGLAGSSRALAITHLAMHDAWFGINPAPGFGTWLTSPPVPQSGASADAAVAAAAARHLSALYPSQAAAFDAHHATSGLGGAGIKAGHAFGLAVAAAVLAARADDPPTVADGYASSVAPGAHRTAPDEAQQSFHAPYYGSRSRCFAVTTRHELLEHPPIGGLEYNDALAEVRVKGIAPELAGTLPPGADRRTPTETLVGVFWGYDGAKGLGTPPRLWSVSGSTTRPWGPGTAGSVLDNQVVRLVADARENSTADNARLFALVNAAMGDAGVLAWDEKYRWDLWRPVDVSTIWMGGRRAGERRRRLRPGLAPARRPPHERERRSNFTPPFPAYPSGHATFGAAALDTVRRFYEVGTPGPDDLFDGLSLVSDEYDGVSTDNHGVVRPRHARSFPGGLWQMIEENGRSRVYLGVHWVFDAFAVDPGTGGMDLDRNIGGVPLGLEIAKDIDVAGLSQAAAAGPRL